MSESTPPAGPSGWVYFFRAGDHIKIGWSRNPKARKASLSTASPFDLEFLGQLPGTEDDEQALHQVFAHLRVKREWFTPDPLLLAFIRWTVNYDRDLGAKLLQADTLRASFDRERAQLRDIIGQWQKARDEERAARVDAESRAAALGAELSKARAELEELRQRWVYDAGDAVLWRVHALREEFERAKDQTDDHEGLASVMEDEIRSASADLVHAVGRCSCGYGFNDDGSAYHDPEAHCGAKDVGIR
jgi:hypothetical protein